MKIAAVLFILSVYYIANTEQAAYPRSWEEMEREVQQGIRILRISLRELKHKRMRSLQTQRSCINVQTRTVQKVRTVS